MQWESGLPIFLSIGQLQRPHDLRRAGTMENTPNSSNLEVGWITESAMIPNQQHEFQLPFDFILPLGQFSKKTREII